MEPALDEASLLPCPTTSPTERITRLAQTLIELDRLGASRVLRSVRDAPDRNVSSGHGLRYWCFDRKTPRDAGLFVAQRLGKAPYIDGVDGLFAQVEAGKAIQPTIGGESSFGGGHVALTDSVLVMLSGSTWPPARPVIVQLEVLTEEGEWTDKILVDATDSAEEVHRIADSIRRKVGAGVTCGATLVGRLPDLCTHLVLGDMAAEQLVALNGSEPYFAQILRHLRALDRAAERWTPGKPFRPEGVTYSVESEATLKNGNFGPMRDFPTPPNFGADRWSLHTKLTGGSGARLYYKTLEFEEAGGSAEAIRRLRIAIGYVGPHLPTVKFR